MKLSYLRLYIVLLMYTVGVFVANAAPVAVPPLLKKGDKVAVVAPAFIYKEKDKVLKEADRLFRSWGLEVVLAPHIHQTHHWYTGTDKQRREDLQWALDDPAIKAVFTLRGGHGVTRIVDALDFAKFKKHPKWIIGFSDITTLLITVHQLGIASVHGEMIKNFGKPNYRSSINSLKTLLFEGDVSLKARPHSLNRSGHAVAPVVGGSLTLINSSLGTPSALDTRGKILCIEEVGENLYALDRAMVQLKRAGKLNHLVGLVVGDMVAMKDPQVKSCKKSALEIVKEHVDSYDYPVAFGFEIGHKMPNYAFPHGAVGTLSVQTDGAANLTFELTQ